MAERGPVGGAQDRLTASPGPDAWRHRQWPSRKVESFVVSFPKSGRTWLRVLLAVVEANRRGADTSTVVSEWLEHEAPTFAERSVLFTHGLSVDAYERTEAMSHFLGYIGDRRRVFLVPDPRDTIVSYFFQVTKRQRGSALANDIGRFLRDPRYGIDRVLQFLAACDASQRDDPGPSLLLSYEELHGDPQRVLAATATFLGSPASSRTLEFAVMFAGFDNMRRLELEGGLDSQPLAALDASDSESLKTRKGVVGGYVDYLSPKDVAYVEKRIEALIPSRLGYRVPGVPPSVVLAQ